MEVTAVMLYERMISEAKDRETALRTQMDLERARHAEIQRALQDEIARLEAEERNLKIDTFAGVIEQVIPHIAEYLKDLYKTPSGAATTVTTPPNIDDFDWKDIPTGEQPEETNGTVTPLPAEVERLEREAAMRAEGAAAFGTLVQTWYTNWDPSNLGVDVASGRVVSDAEKRPQPDRQGALLATLTGHSAKVFAYIRACGGLATAVMDQTLQRGLCLPQDAEKNAKMIAREMIPVAASFSIDLDKLLEVSMFQDPDGPLAGGPAGQSADFARPSYVPQMR